MKVPFRFFVFYLFTSTILAGCPMVSTDNSETSKKETARIFTCPVTEPEWIKPPKDSAVQGSPTFGYYFVNEDYSILASAWWEGNEEYQLHSSEDGIKVGWFRPEGAALAITGRRLDAQAPPLEAHIPCCYPTRFQATGLAFPTEGCWEVAATAADSMLSFVVEVEP